MHPKSMHLLTAAGLGWAGLGWSAVDAPTLQHSNGAGHASDERPEAEALTPPRCSTQ